MLTEKTFNTGEVTLAYLENDSTNPPLVLLHGLTGWRADWTNLLPLLTPNWHVYLLELRGHGNSGRGASYCLTDYVRDETAFLRHIGEPVVLIGFSLGALIALTTASQAPAHVRALVIIDPPLFTGTTSMTVLQRESNGYFTWVYETTKAEPSYESLLAQCAEMFPVGTDEAPIRAMADQVSRVAPGAVEATLQDRLWQGLDFTCTLQGIQPQTLMIHGDWSAGAVVRDEDVALVKRLLPSMTVVRIPGATHLIPNEHPDLVLQSLNEFLTSS
jgi:pimeloyl-ACP methyl ester carboxylesterase